MPRSAGSGLLTTTLAALAVAVCCGLPLAIAFLVTTGLGAVLLAQGWALGLALVAVGLALGVRYLVRARARRRARVGRNATRDDPEPKVRAELHQ